MGMDVYGLKPKTKVGEYFRNNVWYWHPLWNYCCFVDSSLIEKVPDAHCNSGDGLNAVDSRKLGFKLRQCIDDGSAQDYIDSYNERLESLPQEPCYCINKVTNLSSSLDLLLNFISQNPKTQFVADSSLEDSCDSTGLIPFPKSDLKEPNPECSLCKGSGFRQNLGKSYYIDLENIKSFALFLIDCGGFRIC